MRQTTLKILFVTFMVIFGLTGWAKTKVALIGDSVKANQIADLVMAKMSEEFSFLERSEIDKIIKERELSLSGITEYAAFKIGRIIHADILFIIISEKEAGKIKNYSAIAFNAKSGIRLTHLLLPIETEIAVDKMIESFAEITQKQKNIDSTKFVSIGAIRDSGVAFNFLQEKNFLIADLERRLGNSPNLILLERDHLEALNKERLVSGKCFQLVAAASILSLEFLPGESPNVINLTLRIHSSSGELQFRDDIENCFNEPKKTVLQLLNGIVKNLKVSLAENIPSAKEEAENYYHQGSRAEWNGEYILAKRKFSAAIALDPENPDYIKSMIFLLTRRNFGVSKDAETLTPLVDRLEEAMYWCDKYDSMEVVSEFNLNWDSYYCKILEMLGNMRPRFKDADPERHKRIMKIATALKPKYLKEKAKHRPKKIDSLSDLRIILDYNINNSVSYLFYDDQNEYFNDFSDVQLAGLKLIESFFDKYPEKRTKEIDGSYPMLQVERLPYPYLWDNCADYLFNAENLIKAYKSSSVPMLKLHGYKLELGRNLLLCGFSQEDSMSYIIDYAKNMEQFKALGFAKHFFGIPDEEYFPKEYKIKHALIRREVYKLVNSSAEPKPKSLPLKSSLLFRFSDEQSQMLGDNGERRIKAAIFRNDKIYLVYNRDGYRNPPNKTAGKKREKSDIINIVEYDIKESKVKDLRELYYYLPLTDRKPPPIAVEDEHMVISLGYRIVYVNLKNKDIVEIIDKLPLPTVLGISILDKRIYAFLGREGNNSMRDTMLFSCLTDGSKRKIHISTARIDRQHPFDEHYPFSVSSMFADKNNDRLIFNMHSAGNTSEKGGLWAFYPKSGNCKYLAKYVGNHSQDPLFKINNMVHYLNVGLGYYDLAIDKEMFIEGSEENLLGRQIGGDQWKRYFINGDFIWGCLGLGGTIFCWEKGNFKQVASINLRERETWIFPHTDGRSAIAISGCSIYKITPPESVNKVAN